MILIGDLLGILYDPSTTFLEHPAPMHFFFQSSESDRHEQKNTYRIQDTQSMVYLPTFAIKYSQCR